VISEKRIAIDQVNLISEASWCYIHFLNIYDCYFSQHTILNKKITKYRSRSALISQLDLISLLFCCSKPSILDIRAFTSPRNLYYYAMATAIGVKITTIAAIVSSTVNENTGLYTKIKTNWTIRIQHKAQLLLGVWMRVSGCDHLYH
jgi:hypothetical protein